MVKRIHYKAFSWLVIKGMGEFLSLWVLACVTLKVCFWDLVFMWFWESFLTNQVLWRGCFAAFLANVLDSFSRRTFNLWRANFSRLL